MDTHLDTFAQRQGWGNAPLRITSRDIIFFLQTYWLMIGGIFFSTVVLAYAAVLFLTDQYDTTAKLLVRIGREQLEPPPAVTTTHTTMFSSGLRKEDVASEIKILQSPDLVVRVVDTLGVENFRYRPEPPSGWFALMKFRLKGLVRRLKETANDTLIVLGLKKRLNDREQAIGWLLQSVDIVPDRDADVIVLQVRSPDPGLGVQILNTWIELYLQRRLQIRQQTGAKEFLDNEVTEGRAKLSALSQQELEWKQKRVVGDSKEQIVLLQRQIRDLAREEENTLRSIAVLRRETEGMKALIATRPPNVLAKREEGPNPILRKLREELSTLQLERSKLITKFQESSTFIQDLDEQIARVRGMLAQENAPQVVATYEVNPLVTTLEQKLQERRIELEGLTAKTQIQQQQKGTLEAELRALNEVEVQLTDLARERQIAEQHYLAAVKRKRDLEVAAELDLQRISNVSILTPPISSLEPVSPRRLLLVQLSAVVGLLLGLGVALLRGYCDDRIHHAQQLAELTGLRYLGTMTQQEVLPTVGLKL